MSSENSPTSPRDNVVCIPTICLDSLNDSCDSSDQFYVASECETEQSFGMNVSNFFSWLSYFGSQRRFLVAALLVSQCDLGFRRALHLLNSSEIETDVHESNEEIYTKANDCDYLANLKSAGLSAATLTHKLLELLPHLSLPLAANLCAASRRISTASAADHTKDYDLLSAPRNSLFGGSQLQLSTNTEKIQSLKKHYLSLVAETINYGGDIFNFTSSENMLSLSDIILRELVMQQPVSQLLLRVFLHPGFTRDDRSWLCSVVRAQQQSMSAESVAARGGPDSANLSDSHTTIAVQSKAFNYLLEALTDISAILNSPASNSIGSARFASSLSHSLTSSGFLSGCAGSGSQYDLLSEITNGNSTCALQNGGSHYGTLLTVPTSDARVGNNHLGFFVYPGLAGTLDQRRLSDVPYFLSQSSTSTTPLGSEIPATKSCTDSNNRTSITCSTTDYGTPNSITLTKSFAAARASLPNALAAPYPVETITEHASDSVSLSSAGSNFSSNLDLRSVCHHHHHRHHHHQQRGASPRQSSGRSVGKASSISNHENSYSLPPSPPSTAASVSPGMQKASMTNTFISPVSHTGSSRVSCSLTDSNYSALDRDFNERDLYESVEFDGADNPCISDFRHGLDPNVYIGHDSSPEPHPFKKTSKFSEDLSGFSYFCSPMFAVPGWLKSLRLHKYAGLFQRLSYDEFMGITESWLEERNVTQGARTKLLLNIRKLAMRSSVLQQVEADLLQTQSTGPTALSTLRTCMTEIWNILHTPMVPRLPTPPMTADVRFESRSAPSGNDNVGVNSEPSSAPLGVNSAAHSSDSLALSKSIAHEQMSTTGPKEPHTSDVESLPNQIMGCLTKICSRLLVTSQPDLDCCDKFMQLLDVIVDHPAFSEKQRSLTTSWRQQMFNLLDTAPFQSTSDPSRSSRSIPRSYHGGRPFRKPPCRYHPRSKRGTITCSAVTVQDTPTLVSLAMSDASCTSSSFATATASVDQSLGDCNSGVSVNQFQGYTGSTGHTYHPVCSFDDNAHRRHSVPVNQVRPGPQPIRSCQGRRMPSPNPAFMPSRNTQFFFPAPTQASSSDVDLSPSAAVQLQRTRFPSPSSAYEHTYQSGCPRSLIPPATAPPTRMPSPSDLRQHTVGLPPGHQETATSMLLTVPQSPCQTSLACPCSLVPGATSRLDETARTMSRTLQNTASCLSSQPCLGEFHLQPHLLFQRSTVLSDSATPLERNSVPPGLSDLHQTNSLQTSSNPYPYTIGVSRPMRNELDPMPAISPLSRTSLAPLVSHEHSSVSQSFSAVEGSGYHLPTRDLQPNSVHMVTRPGSVAAGANAISSDSHGDWAVSVAGRQYNLHPVYTARDPCTMASLVPTTPSEIDAGTEFIEHNLDLLTRKVTELAIGEFDSPGE